MILSFFLYWMFSSLDLLLLYWFISSFYWCIIFNSCLYRGTLCTSFLDLVYQCVLLSKPVDWLGIELWLKISFPWNFEVIVGLLVSNVAFENSNFILILDGLQMINIYHPRKLLGSLHLCCSEISWSYILLWFISDVFNSQGPLSVQKGMLSSLGRFNLLFFNNSLFLYTYFWNSY